MNLKRMIALLLSCMACLVLFGCKGEHAAKDDNAIVLTIENTAQNRITALSVEWADPSHTIS